jgi:hypothetical protein
VFRIALLVAVLVLWLTAGAQAQPTATPTPLYTFPPSVPSATPIPFGTNPAETDTAAPCVLPSGNAVSTCVDDADAVASSIANINSQFCTSTTAFSGSPTTADTLAIDGTRFIMRRVRDGLGINGGCHNTTALQAFFTLEYGAKSMRVLDGVDGIWFAPAELAAIQAICGCLQSIAYWNESDQLFDPPVQLYAAGGTIAAGSTTVAIQYSGSGAQTNQAGKWIVPGQLYQITDGASSELVTVLSAAQQTDGTGSSVVLQHPTAFSHASGTALNCWSTTGACPDFTYPALNWYHYTAPYLRANAPSLEVLCPSIALPITKSYLFQSNANGYPGWSCDTTEIHNYTIYNPESASGDGYVGVGPQHLPCASGGHSYGWVANTWCVKNQEVGPGYENRPTVTTENSWQQYPYGQTPSTGATGAIPDNVALHYYVRAAFENLDDGNIETYYFPWQQGQDGATSPFCEYGWIITNNCGQTYPGAPYYSAAATALMSTVRWLTDAACPYSNFPGDITCSFTPNVTIGTWSSSALPFNARTIENSAGYVWVFFGQGCDEWDTVGQAPITCATQSETYTSTDLATATGVGVTSLDDTTTDPTPPPRSVTYADGTSATHNVCPDGPATTNYYGCWKPVTALTPSSNAVTVTSQGDPQVLVYQLATAPAKTTATAPPRRALATYTVPTTWGMFP